MRQLYPRGGPSAHDLRHGFAVYGSYQARRELREYRTLLARRDDLEATLRFYLRLKYRGVIAESLDINDADPLFNVEDKEENFTDFGGENTLSVSAGVSHVMNIGQQEINTLDDFLDRPVEIYSGAWDVGSHFTEALSVWELYSSQPSVRAKLRNYAYFRGNLCLRINISGMPFHWGKMLVSYQPAPQRNETLIQHNAMLTASSGDSRYAFLCYLSQAPGSVTMDVRANKPVNFECPFISHNVMYRLFNTTASVVAGATAFVDFENAGDLYLYSINTLDAISASGTNAYVQVYAWMCDVELGTNTATQIEILSESKDFDERERGPVERMTSAAATLSRVLSYIPSIEPLARASEMMFEGMSSAAAWFGWSRPLLPEKPMFVKNRPFCNSAFGIGTETADKLCIDPKCELLVSGDVCASSEDDLVIGKLCGVTSFLDTFLWNDDSDTMANPLWTCRVHPQLDVLTVETLTRNYFQPTAMSFAAYPFDYWRGTIVFRFEIVCSNFHRGKLAFYYEPNINQSSLVDLDIALNKNYLKVIDIQTTSTIELCVHWAQPRAWCKTIPHGLSDLNLASFSTTEYAEQYVNGYVGVVPFTSLQSPDASDIYINVYVRGENMQFNQLDSSNLPTERLIYGESLDLGVTSDLANECHDLNDTSGDSRYTSDYHFGEQPVSFRQLLHRYVTTSVDTVASVVAGDCIVAARPILIAPDPAYGVTSSIRSLLSYLPYAYIGVRGSMRKRVRASGYDADDLSRVAVSLGPIASSATDSTVRTTGSAPYVNTGVALTLIRGSIQTVPHTNGGVECELPFYTNNLFVYACADDWIGTNGTNDMQEAWTKSYYTVFEVPSAPEAYDTRVIEESAIGEDFNFMRFQGAPFFSNDFI